MKAKTNQPSVILSDKFLISRKQKIFFIVLSLVLAFCVGLGITKVIDAPRDLGPKLVYVGYDVVGCRWWEKLIFLGFCTADASKVYYFATDMEKEEVKKYFKPDKATYFDDPSYWGTYYSREEDYTSDRINFKTLSDQQEFYIEYYDKTQAVIKDNELKQTGKAHIISMTEKSYRIAKNSY